MNADSLPLKKPNIRKGIFLSWQPHKHGQSVKQTTEYLFFAKCIQSHFSKQKPLKITRWIRFSQAWSCPSLAWSIMWQEGIWSKEFCVKMINATTIVSDDRFQKATASLGTNLLFLKTCIHFKHLTLAKELLPFINNLFCMLKAMDAWKRIVFDSVYKYRRCTFTAKTAGSMHFFRIP